MPKLTDLPDLVLDLHQNAGRIIDLLKKSIDGLDDIAADKMTAKLNDEKAATKKLFASFNQDLTPDLETIAKPKTTPEATLKAAKAVKLTIQSYESAIRKAADETQNLTLLTSKLSSILQFIEKIIKDPADLNLRKKPLSENWSKTKGEVEKKIYNDLDALAKAYKKDTQRYIDTRKALASIYSAKVIELLGIIAHLKVETAVALCGKISPVVNDIVTRLRKEKLLALEMSTSSVETTINSLVQYTTFTRDGVRTIAGLTATGN